MHIHACQGSILHWFYSPVSASLRESNSSLSRLLAVKEISGHKSASVFSIPPFLTPCLLNSQDLSSMGNSFLRVHGKGGEEQISNLPHMAAPPGHVLLRPAKPPVLGLCHPQLHLQLELLTEWLQMCSEGLGEGTALLDLQITTNNPNLTCTRI